MFKIIKKIRLYNEYKKFVKNNETELLNEFGLEYNKIYELYTTIILKDAPKNLKEQLGIALAENEIKKYINKLSNYFDKNNMGELINIYEIKKINNDLYGITFGFSQFTNRQFFLYKLIITIIITIITIITII